MSVLEEIAAVFEARADALVRGDAGFFRRLLDEDFLYTNASGVVFDRAGYLEFYLESGRARWQAQEWNELEVKLVGDVAIATCRLHDRATFDGAELDASFRSTQVFVKRGGDWRYVAGQTTSCEDGPG